MTRTKRPVKWNLGAVTVLLLALGSLVISSYLAVREYQLGAKGARATGLVTKYEKIGRSVKWTIRYPHQGQPVSATVVPSMFSGLEIGQEVSILYDPSDPSTINVDNFWHRYFYQVLGLGLSALFFWALSFTLWQSDEAWLREYVTTLNAPPEDQPPVDQLVLGVWHFNLSAGSLPRGAIASYFQTYGLSRWSALKAAWDRDAVPSLEPVIAEIDRIIAGRDPTPALVDNSPAVEKFYFARREAILQELRDYATDPSRKSTPHAQVPRDPGGSQGT